MKLRLSNCLKATRKPLGMAEDADFRISIAGAQEKTALLWYQDRWQRPWAAPQQAIFLSYPLVRLFKITSISVRVARMNGSVCALQRPSVLTSPMRT